MVEKIVIDVPIKTGGNYYPVGSKVSADLEPFKTWAETNFKSGYGENEKVVCRKISEESFDQNWTSEELSLVETDPIIEPFIALLKSDKGFNIFTYCEFTRKDHSKPETKELYRKILDKIMLMKNSFKDEHGTWRLRN